MKIRRLLVIETKVNFVKKILLKVIDSQTS